MFQVFSSRRKNGKSRSLHVTLQRGRNLFIEAFTMMGTLSYKRKTVKTPRNTATWQKSDGVGRISYVKAS